MNSHRLSWGSFRFASPLTLVPLTLVVVVSLLGACTVESDSVVRGSVSRPEVPLITFEIEENVLSIPENSAVGTSAGELKATSDVDGVKVSLHLTENEWFELDGTTVRVKEGANLDYETAPSHEIEVAAEAEDANRIALTLSVIVTNVLENTITFDVAAQSLRIPEDASPGDLAGTLLASTDGSGVVSFSIVENDRFVLEDASVQLKDGANLDYETTPSHRVVITAHADDAVDVIRTLSVPVTNALESTITFAAAIQSLRIAEDASAGDLAGTLLASTDGPGVVSFSIVENALFQIDGTTVQLKDGVRLDYETATSYQVVITAHADDAVDVTHTLGVAVTNVFESTITFVAAAQSLSIAEDASADDSAGTLLASTDGPGVVSFAIAENVRFEIDWVSVQLKSGVSLDHEVTASHSITVTAKAKDAADVTHTLVVAVTNVLESTITFAAAAQSLSIHEGAAAGDAAGALIASTDGPGVVSFTVIENVRFEIDGATVQLKSGASLDYDVAASHDITVTAKAEDAADVTHTLSVAVTETFEKAIIFDSTVQELSIHETATPGTAAGTLVANTNDRDVVSSFSIASNAFFVLDGATVRLKSGASLDYEVATSHSITVTASASGLPNVTRTLPVAVEPSVQDGTTRHPYRVNTRTKLQSMASGFSNHYVANHCAIVNRLSGSTCTNGMLDLPTSLASHYVLTANIDASSRSGNFLPIGRCKNSDCLRPSNLEAFTGNFDGQGFAINGLAINRPDSNGVGLFAALGGRGVVTDLVLDGGEIRGLNQVGALVGYNDGGTITDITSSVAVSGSLHTGGLVGYNLRGTIERGEASGVVRSLPGQTNQFSGGLVGIHREGTVRSSVASGDVSGTSSLGGLVGYSWGTSSTVSNSVASGDVSGTSSLGGLVGNSEGTIASSTASGSVSGTEEIGGLVGVSSGNVRNSQASGHVTASGHRAGGLVGHDNRGGIANSRALGNVEGDEEIGGLAGYSFQGTGISDSFASGRVYGSEEVGGLVGHSLESTVTDSMATGEVIGNDSIGGLVGVSSRSTLQGSVATGNVVFSGTKSFTDYRLGGLVGFLFWSSTLQESIATGNVTKTGNQGKIGGLVGYASTFSNVYRSFATGNVRGGEHTGGLIGYIGTTGEVEDVYATGGVTGGTYLGGLIGLNGSTDRTVRGYCVAGSTTFTCVGSGYRAEDVFHQTEAFVRGIRRCGDTIFADCRNHWNVGATTQLPAPRENILGVQAFKTLQDSDLGVLDANNPGTAELDLDASNLIRKWSISNVLRYFWYLPDGVFLAEEDLLSDSSIAVTVADPSTTYTLRLTIMEIHYRGDIERVFSDNILIISP